MEMNRELVEKAKKAESKEELIAMAKENGTELTPESAEAYFKLLHPKTGEVSDDELENVSGGGCYNKGRLVVTTQFSCWDWHCKNGCDKEVVQTPFYTVCKNCGNIYACKYCSYEKGLWLCNNPTTNYGRIL